MTIVYMTIGIAAVAAVLFLLVKIPALVFDRQQLVGIMAACIMGRSSNSDWAGEFDSSMSAGRAVAHASEIMGIIDRTWGPTPALATEQRATDIIREQLRWMLPEAIKEYEAAQLRELTLPAKPDKQKQESL